MIIIDQKNKSKCCGCTACANICPRNAIKMQEDFEGFLYPVIDKKKCTNCGLCNKTCPILNKQNNDSGIEKAYALRSRDKENLRKSTSGGFFTPVAKYIIDNGGIVYGVGFDKEFNVCHKEAKNLKDIQGFKGSKYVQSFLGDIFEKIKGQLKENKTVLFSGTPCQVEGLKRYLNKNYENLITIDLICHGTPSPKLWRMYIDYQEKKYKSKVREAYFRNKTYGYHSSTMKIVFKNGRKYYGSARVDYMLKSFFSEISSRPSCYECQFKKRNHLSDITIYDCWSIEKLNSKISDDDLGYTNIIVNSTKGIEILNNIKEEFEIYNVDLDEQIRYDGSMVEKSAIPHERRNEYYQQLSKLGVKNNLDKFMKITFKDKIIEASKFFWYKLNLNVFLKKIRSNKI